MSSSLRMNFIGGGGKHWAPENMCELMQPFQLHNFSSVCERIKETVIKKAKRVINQSECELFCVWVSVIIAHLVVFKLLFFF